MGLGYPIRLKYEDVRRRYLPRLANIAGSTLLSPKLFAEMIMEVRLRAAAEGGCALRVAAAST